ncbi:MAG: YceI family protein, partial [Bdellovibrionales bacterium]|nr:YceI family protein [Bdellovibrionales bacterium]
MVKRMFFYLTVVSLIYVSNVVADSAPLQLDTERSVIEWTGKKVVGQHDGTVKLASGDVVFDQEHMLSGGTFQIDMSTIFNKDLIESPKDKAKLEGHLKSDDFFDVSTFPFASFKIDKVKPLDVKQGVGRYSISGSLTIKGISKPLAFETSVSRDGDRYLATSDLKIDRVAWDIKYNSGKFFDLKSLGDKLIYDEIEIRLHLATQPESSLAE